MVKKRRFYIETFGCQMNVHDSEMLADILCMSHFVPVDSPEQADIVILNTCSVRAKAEQKVFSRFGVLRSLKQGNENLCFVLAGCMAKAWGAKLFHRVPGLDMIIGPGALQNLPGYLDEIVSEPRPVMDLSQSDDVFQVPSEHRRIADAHHAWVTIMEGCNNFCSYCIVPYVRGPEKSRAGVEIVDEVEHLSRHGVREITLLGQNVNSYQGLSDGFPGLLRRLNDIPGLYRIRFTTSHPKDMSPALITAVAELPKVCEFLHFPVQSGSTKILQKMNRGYTREDYLRKVELIKKTIPDVALSSDIIVGFPGETEQDFLETVSLVREVEFENLFLFNYSIRSGTRAAELDDDVPDRTKNERLELLLEMHRAYSLKRNSDLIGCHVEVLVDGSAKRGGIKWKGRTRHNRVVNFEGMGVPGQLQDVYIESVSPNCLYGTALAAQAIRTE